MTSTFEQSFKIPPNFLSTIIEKNCPKSSHQFRVVRMQSQQLFVSLGAALDINKLHTERSILMEAASLAADATSKLRYFEDLKSRIHQDVMCRQGAALLPLIIGPHGKIMVVFAAGSKCECACCVSQEMHLLWRAAFEPFPPLVAGYPVHAAEIAAQAFTQAFGEELTWNDPADDTFAWNAASVAGKAPCFPARNSAHGAKSLESTFLRVCDFQIRDV